MYISTDNKPTVPDEEASAYMLEHTTEEERLQELTEKQKGRNYMRLYEISKALNAFIDAYEQGEIPAEAYKDTLQGIEMEFEEKAEQIAKIVRNFETDNMGLQSEIDRLQAMATSNSNQIKYLKNYLYLNTLINYLQNQHIID